MAIRAIDHVQLAMPAGGEDDARAFYGALLGMEEVAKPPLLAAGGGCWFQAGVVRIHLGVEAEFRPARKAHPALQVDGLRALAARIRDAGHRVEEDQQLDGHDRVFVDDPFGNRIELLQPAER
jgi:catechol 2,3-dioxygenase-like lactoylglutathione lyase family enzyme